MRNVVDPANRLLARACSNAYSAHMLKQTRECDDEHASSAVREVTGETAPFTMLDGDWEGGLLLICDHARNTIPSEYDNLGLPQAQLERHIAYDIGVEDVTRRMSQIMGAPAVLSGFSRLLIDPNRGEDDPTLIMRLSDGAVVPGNVFLTDAERESRLQRFYRPYDRAIDAAITRMLACDRAPVVVSIHSFTPTWRGNARPWHAGILWGPDPRLARLLFAELAKEEGLVVGDNEPYSGELEGDTMWRHATSRGLAHALVEIRQDLISDQTGANAWAERLAHVLTNIIGRPELHEIRSFQTNEPTG